MAWSWRCETADGTVLEGSAFSDELFASRGDAESWLGETWREVRAAGAARAVLLEGATPVAAHPLTDEI